MNPIKVHDIAQFEEMAVEILTLKNTFRQRRPVVIEFCGSPKAGKTSCIHSLSIFLERNGFKTGIVADQAGLCPIREKHSPAFSSWTVGATIGKLSEMLDPRRREPLDVVLCDRALFDGLCWFRWMLRKGAIERSEYQTMADYISLSRWVEKIDLVYIFEASPRVSVERENTFLLTRKPGSIMNILTLSEYINCIEEIRDEYGGKFRSIQQLDTTSMDQNQVSSSAAATILHTLQDMLVERAGYLGRADLEAYGFPTQGERCSRWQESPGLPLDKVRFVEPDSDITEQNLLQILPAAVFTNPEHNRLLALKRQGLGGQHGAGAPSWLWFGGAVREEDRSGVTNFGDLARRALKRELEDELGLSVALDEIRPCFLYAGAGEQQRALAVCFLLERDLDGLKLSLPEGDSSTGTLRPTILPLSGFQTGAERPADDWSNLILHHIFRLDDDGDRI